MDNLYELEPILSDENYFFVRKLQIKKATTVYRLDKKLDKNIFKVYDKKESKIPKIMKTLQLTDDYFKSNEILDSLRSIFDLMNINGKYKCRNSNRFICFTDLFLSPEIKLVLAYVYDMAKGLDLSQWIEKNKIDFKLLVFITYACFTNLAILHLNKIYHRDIKLYNIVFDPDEKDITARIKFIDFDFSCSANTCSKRIGGTIGYHCYTIFKAIEEKRFDIDISDDLQSFCDIVALAITIFKLYVLDIKNNLDLINPNEKNPLKKDVINEQLRKAVDYREKSGIFQEEEIKFMKFIISLFKVDLNKKYTAYDICNYLYDEYKDILPDELVSSFNDDVNFYTLKE